MEQRGGRYASSKPDNKTFSLPSSTVVLDVRNFPELEKPVAEAQWTMSGIYAWLSGRCLVFGRHCVDVTENESESHREVNCNGAGSEIEPETGRLRKHLWWWGREG